MSLFLVPRRPPRSLYDAVSEASAAVVIRGYSTSFQLASRLLAEPARTRISSLYALVRLADEIVDEPDPAFGPDERARLLGRLREDVHAALASGRSANLVVHAFVRAARECGIGADLVDPFF